MATPEQIEKAAERREKVRELKAKGMTIRRIAEELETSYTIIRRDLHEGRQKALERHKEYAELMQPEVIEEAMGRLGGIDFLIDWAKKNPGEFITKVWLRLLPKKITQTIRKKVETSVFERIERLTAEFSAEGHPPGHRAGESLDTRTPIKAIEEASPPADLGQT